MLFLLKQFYFPCFYKQVFGINCPICGFQRSLYLFFSGNFLDSFILYPPLIPIIFYIMFLFLKLLKNNYADMKTIKAMSIIILFIVVVNYIVKLFFE